MICCRASRFFFFCYKKYPLFFLCALACVTIQLQVLSTCFYDVRSMQQVLYDSFQSRAALLIFAGEASATMVTNPRSYIP